jgi:hypothetical protein
MINSFKNLYFWLLFSVLFINTAQSQVADNQYLNLIKQDQRADLSFEPVAASPNTVMQERDTTPTIHIVIDQASTEKKPEPTPPVEKGKLKNATVYYKSDLKTIQATEPNMQETKFGGIEDSPIHLGVGTILFYKTRKGNFGKMQIMKYENYYNSTSSLNEYKLYIRWTTYESNGRILGTDEYTYLHANTEGWGVGAFDLGHKSAFGYDFTWYVTSADQLLFLIPKKETKFYIVEPAELETIKAAYKERALNTPIYKEPNKTIPIPATKAVIEPPKSKLPVRIVKGAAAVLIIWVITRAFS